MDRVVEIIKDVKNDAEGVMAKVKAKSANSLFYCYEYYIILF